MRVLFFGTSEFAKEPLEALIKSKQFDVVGLISTPDAKGKRGKKLLQPPTKEVALEYGLEVFQPEKLKTEETINKIKEFNADVFVVVSYGKFIPNDILQLPNLKKSINIHPSILPKYRGPSPINYALLNGDDYTGVSLIDVIDRMDAGDIYMQWIEKIYPEDNYKTLHDRLSQIGSKMILCALENIDNLKPKVQDENLATYTKIIKKEDGQIDFKNETAQQIINKIKAFYVWPTAYFYLEGKMFKIFEAQLIKTDITKPAQVIKASKKELIIGCKEDAISIKTIQPQSKKAMPIEAFLAGYKFNAGQTIQ
ncbi:methionyl-tRNA formyltransferase [Hippea maritima]|uniref:Methionyl-tRNA formyltransferase n=1 Tax=Hippea maritima (strain ATCC 700847 / DSM 10411 / MH2) TaxID=760142 RepID=F2LUZ9_HIPMA|nr:methionyl-tRNA formyltransferase [Hippea maritima]AEA33583.1 Methionyl-tRNA formyltransferase [Hippea maritima DSM 10411]